MTLTYRSVKGSALTAAEFDGNTTDLDGRITTLEDNPPSAISISSFEVAGSSFYVHMTDSSVLGPYTLPTASSWDLRGDWQPSTLYFVNDMVRSDSALYLVLFEHTSDTVFDAGANDGGGHDFYELALPAANINQVSMTDANAAIGVGLSYANRYVRMTNASGCVITFPHDDTVDHAVDTEMYFRQCTSDGSLVFTAEAGVTLNGMAQRENHTSSEGSIVMAKKVGANEWDLSGLLSVLSGL